MLNGQERGHIVVSGSIEEAFMENRRMVAVNVPGVSDSVLVDEAMLVTLPDGSRGISKEAGGPLLERR